MGRSARALKPLLLSLVFPAFLCPSSTHAINLEPSELRRLSRGEVVWHKDLPSSLQPARKGFGGTFLILTQASPDAVFKRLTDWPHYSKLFSRVRECDLVEKSGDAQVVHFKVDAIFFNLNYYVRHVIDLSRLTISWDLDSRYRSDLQFNAGSVSVKRDDGLNGTVVSYALSSDVSRPFFLPAFLKRYYMRKEVSRALKELRSAAEKER